VSWWCSSPANVASGEVGVGQRRRSPGTPGLQRADAAPELVATREDAGPQLVVDRALSPLRVVARRADGEDRPRARRAPAAGQGSSARACTVSIFVSASGILSFFFSKVII